MWLVGEIWMDGGMSYFCSKGDVRQEDDGIARFLSKMAGIRVYFDILKGEIMKKRRKCSFQSKNCQISSRYEENM